MQLSSWHFLVFYINFCLLSSLNELQSCNSQVNTVILRYHKPGYPYLINEMSHNLKEIETLLSDEINGLGDLAGSLGGAQKHTWRWNLKFFFHGINFYYKRGYFCEKRGWKSSKTIKFFFAQIPHAFIQCTVNSASFQLTQDLYFQKGEELL